jgi:tetratricopeptide (TPR) repeat protein
MHRVRALASFFVLSLATSALAAGGGGGGGMGGGGMSGGGSSPQETAMANFQSGEKHRKAGLEAIATAQSEPAEAERSEALDKSLSEFKRALHDYKAATRADRKAYYAWNGIGFCQRMLGDYEAALAAYDRALKIEPGFPQAVEYRGEAYLKLGRLEEAKAAYMDLFGRERPLADLLLRKMQAYVADAKKIPQKPGAQARLDEFATWVDERVELAAETASLAPAATVTDFASW